MKKNQDRHNFLKEFKIYEAADKENPFRPELEKVHFMGGYAYATDAHILIRVPIWECSSIDAVQAEKLNGFCIHRQLLKMVYGFEKVTIEDELVLKDAYGNDLEGFERAAFITVVFNGEQIRFRLEKTSVPFIHSFEKILQVETERKPISSIGINTNLLSTIAKALNLESVNMNFTTASDKVYISSAVTESQAIGVIMPVMVSGTLPGMEEEDEEKEEE